MSSASRNHGDPNVTYTFSSRPKPVDSRPRHGDPAAERSPPRYGNIMYDRRVVRGNTYAQRLTPTTAQLDTAEAQRQQAIRRAVARQRARERSRPTTPAALQGRKHVDMQTDPYLEELSNIVTMADIPCQTDPFLDRPASPLFIPAKSGKDVATQIEEGELFHFDWEVQPVLEVLVGKTVEQSLLEVMEEEELACLRAQQRALQELRNNELAEVQRLQEQERRRREEKMRRMTQQKQAVKEQQEVAEKVAARAFTRRQLAELRSATFASLRISGFLFNPVERDIETNFLPWLLVEVKERLEEREAARVLLDALIHDVTRKQLRTSEEATQPEA